MFYHARIMPDPPDGVTLILRDSTIIINPNNIKALNKQLDERKLVFVVVTNNNKLHKMWSLTEDARVVAPPITNSPKILTYPEQKPVIIDKYTRLYFVNPPPEGQENYFIFIKTQYLELLYAPRQTYVRKPPYMDVVITTQETLKQIQKSTSQYEIPKHLGADPQILIVISNKNYVQEPYIFTRDKSIIITRHLTQILAKIEK